MSPRLRPALLAVALAILAASPAQAHKIKAFATAEGATISGYAYFSPGGRAQHVAVTVTQPDGTQVAHLTTDSEGRFRFEAPRRSDYRITVDGDDGHVASTLVPAADLPDTLPGAAGTVPAATATRAAVADTPTGTALPAGDAREIESFIDRSVARQIRPLREQLDAYQEKVWWHDVLGGIGYILGLGGLAYGLTQRRRRLPETSKASNNVRTVN